VKERKRKKLREKRTTAVCSICEIGLKADVFK
jgi:hypothetical protein